MKTFAILLTLILSAAYAGAVELIALPHRTVDSKRTFVRERTDTRQNVWTYNQKEALKILSEFGMRSDVQLKQGEVLVIFLHDAINENLVQIVYNKTANQYFGDYANSGKRFKLKGLQKDKKYTHATALIFKPKGDITDLFIRSMQVLMKSSDSEKR